MKPRRTAHNAPTGIVLGVHRDQKPGKPRKPSGQAPAVMLPWDLTAHGACAQPGVNADAWFTPGREREAIAVCESCPVIVKCLEWAAACNPQFGIWAGTTPQQRVNQRRREQRLQASS